MTQRASRLTVPRPWAPLSDQEWSALLPYLLHRSPQGRPIADLRQRMDGIFHVALTNAPWHALPARFGKPDTASRYFRRLTHAGLWQKLLHALTRAAPAHPLRAAEYFICRAIRRAHRILGFPLLVLIRRIGLRTALPGPPWLLPDPLLSGILASIRLPPYQELIRGYRRHYRALIAGMKHLHTVAAGRASIRRSVRLGWP